MYASLTVVTHPARRTLSALRTARRCARSATERPGMTFARTMLTGTFRTDMRIPFVPGRVAVMLRSRDNAAVGRQLATAEGYLGGLGLADTPLTTCSFSCWRTARDSRAFAFGAGTHRTAYKIDEAEQRHTDNFFVRFRPVRSEGTFEGRDPLAAVLASAQANPI